MAVAVSGVLVSTDLVVQTKPFSAKSHFDISVFITHLVFHTLQNYLIYTVHKTLVQ